MANQTLLVLRDPKTYRIAATLMDLAQSPPESGHSGFPESPSEFDNDPRISFSKLDDKFILETDEGTEYEWDNALRRWIPVVGSVPLTCDLDPEEAMPPL